jgi:phosphatidate cytidylyltransferase
VTELSKRIAFAVIAGPLFLALLWLGGWYFRITILVIGLLIQYEMGGIADHAGLSPNMWLSYLTGIWIILYPTLPAASIWGYVLLLILMLVETLNHKPDSVKRIFGTLFCSLYAPLSLAGFLYIRNDFGTDMQGFALCLSLVLMVWGNDIFAYFGGRTFGKHLLAPHISPKKTWEGFVSGFVGAGVGLVLVQLAFGPSYPIHIIMSLTLILVVSIFGPAGDLAESKLKRFVNIKDSSDIIPGHGGVFDRFDALLMAALSSFILLKIAQEIFHVSF